MDRPLLNFKALRAGSTVGIFTPSSPGYYENAGLFENGILNLKKLGFEIVEGALTKKRARQGYRSANPKERADEFMELILNPAVDGLISTIGGSNSSSLIPYLDFELIRKSQKLICGFSDVTSLHLAVLKFAGLRTLYGPSVMCWFGDWPNGITESTKWFLEATSENTSGIREVICPTHWSNHKRNWQNGDWKKIPREWKSNEGWKVLRPGIVEAPLLAVNFNTLMTAAGTPYWPDLNGKVLLLEDMSAPQSRTERLLRHLSFMGAFDQISGLIIGKAEFYEQEDAPFAYDELFLEVIGEKSFPIVSNFDCGHTLPMISIPQLAPIRLEASSAQARFYFL